MKQFPTYEAVKKYLYSLKHRGAKYGIDRMLLLSDVLEHPDRKFPSIHVAGTNGKGSVCAMLESIYRTAGYRTGLFTSPHLVHQGERVQVNRQLLSREAIMAYTERLKVEAEALAAIDPDDHPSFFEFMTAMAFLRFAEAQVDIGLIEVGLGGRLDATNVILPEVCAITSVSLDHTRILGDTLAAIAWEKAGIIKPGVPVVIGPMPSEAEAVIRQVAQERGAPLHLTRERFGDDPEQYPQTSLAGRHQRYNAGVAAMCAELNKRPGVTSEEICEGLMGTSWPGRWERQKAGGRTLILDTSHNPGGAEALDDNFRSLLPELGGRKPVVVTGALGGERSAAILSVIARYAREIYLVRPAQPRASTFEELEAAVPKDFTGRVTRSSVKGLFPFPGHCAAGEPGDTVVTTGSIYLIGEVMEALMHETPVAEHYLQDSP